MDIKEIAGFNGRYFISEYGFVYNAVMKRMRPCINRKTGYCTVLLWKDGKAHMRYVHRLVAEAFLDNPGIKCEVNHKDGCKQNNAVWNLEWISRSANMAHAYRTGLRNTTAVSAFTKDGKFVKTFESVSEAKRFCNVSYNAGISNCLTGKTKTAHGYIWKYADHEGSS